MPGDAAFWRSNQLYAVAAGDTVAAFTGVVSGNGYSYPSSWAPDGSRIVFSEYLSGTNEYGFVAASPDGTSRDTINVTGYYDYSPAWSPDGTRIAFVRYETRYSVFLVDADGQNLVRLTDTLVVDYNSRLDWSPDGSRLALRAYNLGACCSYKLWQINADGTGLAEVYPGSGGEQPLNASWSPAGDSLAYDHSSLNMIFRVAASGDSVGVRVARITGVQDFPNWSPAGVVFKGLQVNYGIFLIPPGGRALRITDGTSGDARVVLRRDTRYVQSVTMAPADTTVFLEAIPVFTAAVSVLDNTGAGIVPGSGIRCTSSNPAVATVVTDASQNCVVTAVGLGTATITATAGGWRSSTASVTVQ